MFNSSRGIGLLILILALFMGCLCPAAAADNGVRAEVAEIIRDHYVEPVSPDVLNASTVAEMLKRLDDPYASYLTEEEYQKQVESLDGNFTGVGIYITGSSEGVQVLAAIKGSPAAKAGLRKGDIIIEAGGLSLAGLDSDQAMEKLRGPVGSEVILKVKRGEQHLTVNIIREKVDVPTVNAGIGDKETAYISIADFGHRTYNELEAAVKAMQKERAGRWIVDLRGNPGGYLDTAIDIAGVFIGAQPVVIVEEKEAVEGYIAPPASVLIQGPMVLLLDENSASSAEILAGALRDNGRALLVGQKTYGKGTVQQIFPLSNGNVLKLTVARFYSPTGAEINKVGITPDVEVNDENLLDATDLLLSDNRDLLYGKMIGLELERFTVAVDCGMLRQSRYWEAWADIVDGIGDAPVYFGNDSGWNRLSDEEIGQVWPLYYPGYDYLGELLEDDGITLDMGAALNERYINSFNIELINARSGARVKCELELANDSTFNCRPLKPLESGEYWLVIHDTLRFADGERLPQGQITVIKQ